MEVKYVVCKKYILGIFYTNILFYHVKIEFIEIVLFYIKDKIHMYTIYINFKVTDILNITFSRFIYIFAIL